MKDKPENIFKTLLKKTLLYAALIYAGFVAAIYLNSTGRVIQVVTMPSTIDAMAHTIGEE